MCLTVLAEFKIKATRSGGQASGIGQHAPFPARKKSWKTCRSVGACGDEPLPSWVKARAKTCPRNCIRLKAPAGPHSQIQGPLMADLALAPTPLLDLGNFLQQEVRLPHLGDDNNPWHYRGWLLPYVVQLHPVIPAVRDRWGYHLACTCPPHRLIICADPFDLEQHLRLRTCRGG
jgi:hypothetical protein